MYFLNTFLEDTQELPMNPQLYHLEKHNSESFKENSQDIIKVRNTFQRELVKGFTLLNIHAFRFRLLYKRLCLRNFSCNIKTGVTSVKFRNFILFYLKIGVSVNVKDLSRVQNTMPFSQEYELALLKPKFVTGQNESIDLLV